MLDLRFLRFPLSIETLEPLCSEELSCSDLSLLSDEVSFTDSLEVVGKFDAGVLVAECRARLLIGVADVDVSIKEMNVIRKY